MKVWFDTEFIEDGRTIDLLSIGMVREDGATYYAESSDADRSRACNWVRANVLPHLSGPLKPRSQIAEEIVGFVGEKPEFWAFYADYDWVALCQLFGRMVDIPESWPRHCLDVKQFQERMGLRKPPQHQGNPHNALTDAICVKDYHEALIRQKAIEAQQLHWR